MHEANDFLIPDVELVSFDPGKSGGFLNDVEGVFRWKLLELDFPACKAQLAVDENQFASEPDLVLAGVDAGRFLDGAVQAVQFLDEDVGVLLAEGHKKVH